MPENTLTAAKTRYYAIDELRGIAMILVVVYHFFWSLYMFGCAGYPDAAFWKVVIGRLGAFLFLTISGASCAFTRRPYIRALKILGCAVLVWAVIAVTKLADPIDFGVLHLLGCCSLLYALLKKPLEKLNPRIAAPVCALLFILLYNLPRGNILGFSLPEALYSTNWLFWLGLPNAAYTASDYFPLLPWAFLFFFGFFLWRIPKTPPRFFAVSRCRALAFIGRHTLIIYLVHQPVFFGLLWLWGRLFPA